jgi:hypothetical protein
LLVAVGYVFELQGVAVGGCHLVIYLLLVVECWLLIVGDVVLLLVVECRLSNVGCD